MNDYLKAHPELSTDNDAAIAEYAELYGITEDQAESRMDAIVYREANREVFGAEYALRTYNADVYDKARAAYAKGVSYETYYDYYFATKEMHADKDENGKSISGSKKAKVVEYINSLDIPPEQKDALYVAAGYTAKSARNQKWNGGSGGSGGRRGRGKRTALKAPTPKAPEIIIPRTGTASSAKAGGTSKTEGERERDRGLHEDGERDGHSESRDAGKEEGAQGRKPDGVRRGGQPDRLLPQVWKAAELEVKKGSPKGEPDKAQKTRLVTLAACATTGAPKDRSGMQLSDLTRRKRELLDRAALSFSARTRKRSPATL